MTEEKETKQWNIPSPGQDSKGIIYFLRQRPFSVSEKNVAVNMDPEKQMNTERIMGIIINDEFLMY
jgi:hypothetical protein